MEEKTVQVKKGMPRQTVAFVTFLIVVTVFLVGLAVYTQKPGAPTPVTQQPTSPSYAHTTLRLTPPVNTPSLPNTYSTDVSIATGGDKVTAAQLELSYDPKVLTNVQIKPGTFIQNPVVLLKKVDEANGRISLAIGIPLGQAAPTGTGTVATITFDEIPTATGSTILDFLPKTAVTAQGIAQSVLKTSTGSLFFVNQIESPTPAATIIPVAQ
ncbi:MAG: cohesin domain-containing protein [Patescibacteria group bacterium]|nr:cohesin domain-containing protein [Patescibacteria group bacterium]